MNNEPAFPLEFSHDTNTEHHYGLTKLESASINIASGIMANNKFSEMVGETEGEYDPVALIPIIVSGLSVSIAEAVLKESEKRQSAEGQGK